VGILRQSHWAFSPQPAAVSAFATAEKIGEEKITVKKNIFLMS